MQVAAFSRRSLLLLLLLHMYMQPNLAQPQRSLD